MKMQQTTKTTERQNRIAAHNAAISRRGMPPVSYSLDHSGRHQVLQAVLAGLRPTPISEASRLPEEALLARLCRQNRLDGLQAGLWVHRHLLAVIPDAGDLDADTLDEKFREITAAIAGCGSVAEIRIALNINR
jgi:hypothetical protein